MIAKFVGIRTIGNLERRLTTKNRGVFKSIRSYINNSNLTGRDKKDVLLDVFDMILQGQEDGRDIEYIVGEDHQKFCEDIINEYKEHNGRLYSILCGVQQHVFSAIVFSGIISLLEFFFGGGYQFTLTGDNFLLANIFALAMIDIRKNAQRESFIIGVKQRFLSALMFNNKNNSVVSFFSGLIVYFMVKYVIKFVIKSDILSTQLTSEVLFILGIMLLILLVSEFFKRMIDGLNR